MAAKNTQTADNALAALAALRDEASREPQEFASDAELVAYVSDLDSIVELVRSIKKGHAKRLAVIASKKSRDARKERVAKALALLAEQEAAEAR
ncbi:hypothetical protein [Microbacterium sp. NPDC077057]|uniref:hypothetical protein n=1 Tax=unclassified Microbacterium TaxID=2609290 RepID=UPI0034485F1F